MSAPWHSLLAWSAGAAVSAVLAASAQDSTPPTLLGAGSTDGSQIGLCFSEVMDAFTLGDPANYRVNDSAGMAPVASVSVRPGNAQVAVHLSQPVSGLFAVKVDNLFDLAGNPIAPGSTATGQVWRSPLTLVDVGTPDPSGSGFTCLEDELTVSVGGNNIGDMADECSFAYWPRTNDFDVRVRVDQLAHVGHDTAKAGLHARASLDPASPMVLAYVTPTNGANEIILRVRLAASGGAFDTARLPLEGLPVWLRLKRSGTFFGAYTSPNGMSWTALGTPLNVPNLPAVALVGLGSVSHVSGTATTARYHDFDDTVFSNAVLSITQQPTHAIVEANTRATFTVAASVTGVAASELNYQWQAETSPGSDLFTNSYFANRASYTTPFLAAADSGTHFRVVVSVGSHPTLLSETASVTVVPDVTGPRLISARPLRTLKEIVLSFSEPLALDLAESVANYSVAVPITNASLAANQTEVRLKLGAALSPGATYAITVAGLTDLAGHLLDPSPTTVSFQAFVLARGFALQELYFDIPGEPLSNLHEAAKFPDAPDDVNYVTLLEGPLNAFDSYGARLSGFLVPPVSGNYNFWMASDDQGEFWLSTDAEPAHLVRICSEPEWNSWRDYDSTQRRPGLENRSTALFPNGIPLVASNYYYFEALMKEGGSADTLAVAWQIPGGLAPANGDLPIPSTSLACLVDPVGARLEITQHPTNLLYGFSTPSTSDPETLMAQDFSLTNGGYTVFSGSNPGGPWRYDAASGSWLTYHRADCGPPAYSRLTSPTWTVTRAGTVHASFVHRYSFEYSDNTRWDGGQLRLSVNGAPYTTVPVVGFLTNGYQGILGSDSILVGQPGFNGDSTGYATGAYIRSIASLGFFSPGNTVSVQFLAAWDDCVEGQEPNWQIDSVTLTQGEPGQAPATFLVAAAASLSSVPNAPILYQWQRGCGPGFVDMPGATKAAYSFVPTVADVGCQFRCRLTSPGASVTSQAALLTVAPPQLIIRRTGTNQVMVSWSGLGRLQNALDLTGPWANVSSVTNNTAVIRPSAARRFYRVVVP